MIDFCFALLCFFCFVSCVLLVIQLSQNGGQFYFLRVLQQRSYLIQNLPNMMMTIFTSFLRHLNANTWPPTLCVLPSLGGQGTLHQAHLMTFLKAKVKFLGPGRYTEGRRHKVNLIQHSYLQKSLNPFLSMMSRDLGPLNFHFTRASIWSKFALANTAMVRT